MTEVCFLPIHPTPSHTFEVTFFLHCDLFTTVYCGENDELTALKTLFYSLFSFLDFIKSVKEVKYALYHGFELRKIFFVEDVLMLMALTLIENMTQRDVYSSHGCVSTSFDNFSNKSALQVLFH